MTNSYASASKDKSPPSPRAEKKPDQADMQESAPLTVASQPVPLPGTPGPKRLRELDALSDEDLDVLLAEGQALRGQRKAKREEEILTFVQQQLHLEHVSRERLRAILDLDGAGRRTKPKPLRADAAGQGAAKPDGRNVVKPKYRNPADHAQVWTGRGTAPPWIKLGDECSPRGTRLPLPEFLIPEGEV
jgi:DNA-binding protein H-NS